MFGFARERKGPIARPDVSACSPCGALNEPTGLTSRALNIKRSHWSDQLPPFSRIEAVERSHWSDQFPEFPRNEATGLTISAVRAPNKATGLTSSGLHSNRSADHLMGACWRSMDRYRTGEFQPTEEHRRNLHPVLGWQVGKVTPTTGWKSPLPVTIPGPRPRRTKPLV